MDSAKTALINNTMAAQLCQRRSAGQTHQVSGSEKTRSRGALSSALSKDVCSMHWIRSAQQICATRAVPTGFSTIVVKTEGRTHGDDGAIRREILAIVKSAVFNVTTLEQLMGDQLLLEGFHVPTVCLATWPDYRGKWELRRYL